MSVTVAELLVDTLEGIAVKQIFGLIGDSLNPIADAVRHTQIEWVGVRHEEGAALAAAGQAKLTGRLGVCCGTTGPGSTHLVAGLYEASRDHAPVLALSGEMPRKLHGQEYFQATECHRWARSSLHRVVALPSTVSTRDAITSLTGQSFVVAAGVRWKNFLLSQAYAIPVAPPAASFQ